MIATGDHQHARILAEVVRAGKDCYCEKPMANTAGRRQAGARCGDREQAGRADGIAVAELPVSAARAGDHPTAASWARSSRSARAGTTTARAGTCRRTRTSPRFASGTPTGSAGCSGGPSARSIRASTSRFRIFKDFSGGITDQWYSHGAGAGALLSRHVHPRRHGLERRHLRVARRPREPRHVPVRCRRSRRTKCSTPTAPPSATRTAITRSFAARAGTLYSPGGEGSPQWWFARRAAQPLGIERRLRSALAGKRSPNRCCCRHDRSRRRSSRTTT